MASHRSVRTSIAAVAVVGLAVTALPAVAAPPDSGPTAPFTIDVLSSPPDLVSGDDARISIGLPNAALASKVRVTLDDADVTGAFAADPDDQIAREIRIAPRRRPPNRLAQPCLRTNMTNSARAKGRCARAQSPSLRSRLVLVAECRVTGNNSAERKRAGDGRP